MRKTKKRGSKIDMSKVKKGYFRSLFLLLLAGVLLLSGCGKEDSGEENPGQGSPEVSLEKGRYAEEALTFLNVMNNLFDLKKAEDGTVQIVFESEPGSLYFYESADRGKTWESKLEVSAGELPQGYRAIDACIDNDGAVIISAGEMSTEAIREQYPVGKYEYYVLQTGDGNEEAIALDIPEGKESDLAEGYGLRELEISESNLLYGILGMRDGEGLSSTLYCFDLENGQQKWSKKMTRGEFALFGDKIYLNEAGQEEGDNGRMVKTLDAVTGEETDGALIPQEVNFLGSVDVDIDNQKLYFGTKSGIFSSDMKLTLKEKLVDGNVSGLSESGYNIHALYMLDEKVFLVFMQDNMGKTMKTLRYEYDAEAEIQHSTGITIYSLKKSSVMEKMVFDFRKQHPEISVNYVIGMEGQNVATETDAINILNTEIMAGKGPDVLVLNGLPWQSYAEKGLLLNLEEEIAAFGGKEEFFVNLFEAYKEKNGQFVMPVSFKIPVVLSNQEVAEKIDSLEKLTATTGQTGAVVPHFKKDERLIRFVASTCWETVQKGERIDRDALKNMLEQTKEMNDILLTFDQVRNTEYEFETENMIDLFEIDTMLNVDDVRDKYTALELGYLSDISAYVGLYNSEKVERGYLGGNNFSALLSGINAKTEAPDLAKQFMKFILSAEEQQSIFSITSYPSIDNLPVNRTAFRTITEAPSEEKQAELFQYYRSSGMDYRWPDEAYFRKIETEIEQLTVPTMEDSIVIDTVVEYGAAYLKGEKDIDTAVNEITQKLELYFAE